MKYKNYLMTINRNGRKEFILARGHALEDDPTLAVVKPWSEEWNKKFSIIDIASGLGVISSSSKKELLKRYEERKEEFAKRIPSARLTSTYKTHCFELETEMNVWRISGYEF